MGFFKLTDINFLSRWRGKNDYSWTPELVRAYLNNSGNPEWLDICNENAFEIYIRTAEVYSVIQRRGYMLAAGTWKEYKTTGDKVEEVINSEAVKLLENPNPLLSGNDFLRQWSENMLVFGNNYMYNLKGFSTQEIPSGLTNLAPPRMKMKTTGKYWDQTKIENIIEKYVFMEMAGVEHPFKPRDILHTKMVNGLNPYQGDSPLIPLNFDISNIRAAKKFRNVIMTKNGALGMLSNKSASGNGAIPITADERQRIEKQYAQHYGAGDKQIQIMIAQGALEWTAMTYPTKEMMLFEEVGAGFRNIIDGYGLNDNIFSREKASTMTNLQDGFKHAYQATVIPDAEEKAMAVTQQFRLHEKGHFLDLDYSSLPILQQNEQEKATALDRKANAVMKLQQSTLYSKEEIRTIADL